MSDIVLEVEESQPVEMSVAEQIVIGSGGDVGPGSEMLCVGLSREWRGGGCVLR